MRPRRLAATLLLILLVQPATADESPAFDPQAQARLFMVRDTITVRNLVESFRKRLARGQIAAALREGQRVLDRHADDFFLVDEQFIDVRGRSQRTSTPISVLWRSAAELVRETLIGLPESQRAAYDEFVSPLAGPLMKEGLIRRSRANLREVLARFGASRSGRIAGRTLTRFALESGRYRDAAWFAAETLRFHPADLGLWQMRIDALAWARDLGALDQLTLPAGLPAPTDGAGVDVRAYLETRRKATPSQAPSRDWPVWGGGPGRNRVFPHESPLPRSLRWTEYTDFVERQRDRESVWYRESPAYREFRAMLKTFRPSFPVARDRTVYVGDGRSLRAHDIYSGRRLWTFDAARYPDGEGAPFALLAPGRSYPGRTSIERPFAPLVVDDLLIGTVEEKLPYFADTLQRIEISTYLPRRRLVALDRKTGDLKWVFAQQGMEMLQYRHLGFISPPVAAEGLVLGLAAAFDGIHTLVFLAIDAQTGKVRWSREIGTGQQELNLFGVPVKELAASPVTVADGVAYVSTGLGFVAALDVRTGVPRWLASYETMPVRAVEYWYRSPLRLPKVAPNPPRVHKNLLIVAPTDSPWIYVFDRTTGQLAWRAPVVDPDAAGPLDLDVFAHVLGVTNDSRRDVLITTDARVVARALFDDPTTPMDERGRIVWKSMLIEEIRGTGAITGSRVVVPGTGGLHQFSIKGQGRLAAEPIPWPAGAEPGNLLPLERVLIVAARDHLQWFYDWADLERDLERRRREQPDDPAILLEAGELYLRAGDETLRARRAFAEALRIAKRSARASIPAAQHGLYLAWLREGVLRKDKPTRAAQAYSKALSHAATPEERVKVRLALHEVHAGDLDLQRRNLDAFVKEAGDSVVTTDPSIGPIRARAHALQLAAGLEADAGKPARAIDHLQQILRDMGDARYGAGTLRQMARLAIEEILVDVGRAAYAKHERAARALVSEARSKGDEQLLEQVIREYPNAEILAEALLVRADQQLRAGDAAAAVDLARKILSGRQGPRVAVNALALLARAYRSLGARGAAALTLHRLAQHDGNSWTTLGDTRMRLSAFMEAEHAALPTEVTTPVPGLEAPLAEIGFEAGSDDTNSRSLDLATSADASGNRTAAGVSVMAFGRECVVFNMRTGKAAWRGRPGVAQRGAWIAPSQASVNDGRLVIAIRDGLRGYDDLSGTEVWEHDVHGFVRDLVVQGAVVFAVVQANNLAGTSSLLALDAVSGTLLWSRGLGSDNPRRLRVWKDRVVLERTRWSARENRAHLLLYDAFDGRPIREVKIPTQTESGDRLIVGGAFVLASRELDRTQNRTIRRVVAYDLKQGVARWRRTIPGSAPITALAEHAGQIIVLLADGRISTIDGTTGKVVARTKIHVTTGVPVRPFVQSRMIVTETALTFLPATRNGTRSRPAEPALMCFDRQTGKLRWQRKYPPGTDLNAAHVRDFGRLIAVVASHRKNFRPHVNIRLIGAEDGALLQEIVPDNLAQKQWVPSSQAGYGTLVVFGRRGASIFRRPADVSGLPRGGAAK